MEFGCGNAMAYEDGRAFEALLGLLGKAGAHEIAAPLKIDVPALPGRAHTSIGLRIDTHQRHFLEIGSIVAGRLGASLGELIGNIFRSQVATPLADAASFQQIAGKIFDICANAGGGDGGILG
jgi:hypothetical protein